ncbi:HAD-IB family hydrolase [Paenibacillus sp. FSL M7-1046]|uniref:HAD-IB family hydrolase n=1 Tax=Paenibacillus sp. FSL M7-1046 TaxID=2975315 RepID=UPI0030F4DAC7
MKTKFAFWDVDHTLLRGDSMLLFLWYGLRKKPLTAYRIAVVLWRTLCYKFGLITAEQAKAAFFYAVNGFSDSDLEHFFDTQLRTRIYQDAYEELRRLKMEGFRILLVSASPYAYLKFFKKLPEVDFVIGTELMRKNGCYVPLIQGLNCKGEEKVERIRRYLEDKCQTIDFENSCAYSDSLSDLPMFRLVRNRYLVNGQHPELEARQWDNVKTPYLHAGKIYMVLSAFLTATGQLFWKWGWDAISYFALGFLCYGGGAFFMIRSLSLEKLSVAYPLMCLSYFFALGYGYWILHEPITWDRFLAVVLMGIGVCLISYER